MPSNVREVEVSEIALLTPQRRKVDGNPMSDEVLLEGDLHNNILEGDIQKQKLFLDGEVARVHTEEHEAASFNNGMNEDKPSYDNNEIDTVSSDWVNMKMSDLIEMKQLIDEVYGRGVFEKAIGNDFAKLVSKVRDKILQPKAVNDRARKNIKENQGELGKKEKPNNGENTVKPQNKIFLQALIGRTMDKEGKSESEAVQLVPTLPRIEGGNVVVQVDKKEYQQSVKNLQFGVIGRINFQNKELELTTMDIHRQLASFGQISDFKLVALRKGFYHVILHSMSDQTTSMCKGPVNLHPDIFRVSRWLPGFNPATQFISTLQVWIRIKDP